MTVVPGPVQPPPSVPRTPVHTLLEFNQYGTVLEAAMGGAPGGYSSRYRGYIGKQPLDPGDTVYYREGY